MDVVLSVRQYGVSFGRKTILSGVGFDLLESGVTVLMGPCGTGKSTLLRSLSGLNDASSAFSSCGTVCYLGESLGRFGYPSMVIQKPSVLSATVKDCILSGMPERESLSHAQSDQIVSRLLAAYGFSDVLAGSLDVALKDLSNRDRRVVYMLSAIACSPRAVFFDEPTSDLSEEDALSLLSLISKISEQRAVMVVLHNQNHAKSLSHGSVMLLAGGRIQEHDSVQRFFESPRSEAGKDFVRTGSCAVPSPDADPECIDPDFLEKYKPAETAVTSEMRVTPFGTSGFKWIIKGSLAAMPRPGLLEDLDFDLAALKKIQIDHIITLEEFQSVPKDAAQKYGIDVHWMPIVDMGVPDFFDLDILLEKMQELLTGGHKVAVHCKAGLGRTGTVIAAYFIRNGKGYEEAIQAVRCADPRMVQSVEQEKFLMMYAERANQVV